jgi:hypothetical protein
VISGLIAVCRNVLRLPHTVWTFCIRVFNCRGFAKIIKEFLTEVAVLVLVFPTLDVIIQKGASNVSKSIVLLSLTVTALCLFAAGIISMMLGED